MWQKQRKSIVLIDRSAWSCLTSQSTCSDKIWRKKLSSWKRKFFLCEIKSDSHFQYIYMYTILQRIYPFRHWLAVNENIISLFILIRRTISYYDVNCVNERKWLRCKKHTHTNQMELLADGFYHAVQSTFFNTHWEISVEILSILLQTGNKKMDSSKIYVVLFQFGIYSERPWLFTVTKTENSKILPLADIFELIRNFARASNTLKGKEIFRLYRKVYFIWGKEWSSEYICK